MFDFLTTLRMSFVNLKNNAMRTFLTMLGVIIGIASIIALLTIGQGVTNSVIDKISGLGGNRLTVSASKTAVHPGFTESELSRFASLEGVSGVSPSLVGYHYVVLSPELTNSKYDEHNIAARRIMGVSSYYFSSFYKNAGMKYGAAFSSQDVNAASPVCVIGYNLWQTMYGNYNPVGEIIKIGGIEFRIAGVMNKIVGLDVSGNDAIMVPYTAAIRSLSMGLPSGFDVVFDSAEDSESVTVRVKDLCAELLNSPNGSGYSVVDQQELADVVLTVTDLVLGMLAGIAIISLVVGGIGIMNMMLVTVSERTAEIGLRKALGARPSVILMLFLTEAMILSLAGGVAGVVIGLGISYLAAVIIGYAFSYNVTTVLLAVGFSLAVGVIFGILPARRAAKLNPIDALRST